MGNGNKKKKIRDMRGGSHYVEEGGKKVSHKMAWYGDPSKKRGEFSVAPTVAPKKGKAKSTKPSDWKKQSFSEAKEKGEVIKYKSKRKAEKVAAGSWKKGKDKKAAMKNYRKRIKLTDGGKVGKAKEPDENIGSAKKALKEVPAFDFSGPLDFSIQPAESSTTSTRYSAPPPEVQAPLQGQKIDTSTPPKPTPIPSIADEVLKRMDPVTQYKAKQASEEPRPDAEPMTVEEIAEAGYKGTEESFRENFRTAEETEWEGDGDLDLTSVKASDIDQLSKHEVKNIQTQLASEGLLKGNQVEANAEDEQSVMKTQKFLKSRGFDLGKYGKNKDGVDGKLGPKTKAAITKYNKEATKAEIDGLVGPKTKEALRAYKKATDVDTVKPLGLTTTEGKEVQGELQTKGYFQNKIEDFDFDTSNILLTSQEVEWKEGSREVCDRKECTAYVGQEIERKIKQGSREDIGAYGDAWTIQTSLMGAGGKEIYNVFPEEKPDIKNPENYIRKITEAAPNITEEDVSTGDVVNMYYGGSTSHAKAYKEGQRVFSTHTGIIKMGKNGEKIIEHNVDGKIYKEPLKDFLQNKVTNKAGKPVRITAITRPNYDLEDRQDVYEPTETRINWENTTNEKTALGYKSSAEFTQTLINNKDLLLKDIPIQESEMNNLIRAARAIKWNESGSKGGSPKHWAKDIGSDAREALPPWTDVLLSKKYQQRESSKGHTQLKDEENMNPALRENLQVTDESLADPKKSAIATMYTLSTKYIQIKNGLETGTDFTDDELAQLALLSWNIDVEGLIKTANKYKTLQGVIDAYKKEGEGTMPYKLTLDVYNNNLKQT